jgi:hypothetical protein
MKPFIICSVVATVVLGLMGVQMGVFKVQRAAEDEPSEEKPIVKPVAPRAKFPKDLAPAAQANAVPQAAEFKVGAGPHKFVFMKPNGLLHPWHESVREDWLGETVETTELVIVVGTPKKQFVDRYDYAGGAPPILRYLFDLEISVVEAKSGKILANRYFKNTPRPIMKVETWDTTAIGKAVSVQQVFTWVKRMSENGFPDSRDQTPIVTEVE